ncbi:EngB/YsxC GTP-binding protein [Candidatus Bealeia paramacronuclearis]|uniref:Probable GTP-binding protein EngB n=1 Tax=Candidatus Bealeia paramacronuclearis TaxID=1921001 RepID=A0ABZ2C4A6_9PROT|nr:EngB/YsxC GTP-binding protein [Candidatus Bealeia paramacronuclearis]
MEQESENFEAYAQWLFCQPCDFIAGAAQLDRIPEALLPEVAFAGRSNVGKSSLINALTNRKTLAKTSKTPGRTQQLNFFKLGESVVLVDMPGYGYAEVSKAQQKSWHHVLTSYLKGRVNLRRCFILVDSRHGLKASDLEMMKLLDNAAVVYQIVLTKCDKVTASEFELQKETISQALKKHTASFPEILATSSETKEGLLELKCAIAALGEDG